MAHSSVVGGSSAKRAIMCPGSVKLSRRAPTKPSSSAADEGTLCHMAAEAFLLGTANTPEDVIGMRYGEHTLTREMYDDLIAPALATLDVIDPDKEMDYCTEVQVAFGATIPGAFGTADILGRRGDTVVLGDWKFGYDPVPAEESPQGLFYLAASRRTPELGWLWHKAAAVEVHIIQPKVAPGLSSWTTTIDRVIEFEAELRAAIALSQRDDAPLAAGDWCKWCPAKTLCPVLTGAADRLLATQLDKIDAAGLADLLNRAPQLEDMIAEVRSTAQRLLEAGREVPGYKLVQKRAIRRWADQEQALGTLRKMGLTDDKLLSMDLISPAQAEKLLRAQKLELPTSIVSAVSSGNTVAPESDPRPAVNLLGKQLAAALSKLL